MEEHHRNFADRKCVLKVQEFDSRDYVNPDEAKFKLRALGALPPLKLPPAVSLKESMPSVLDQGNVGSCAANAMANLLRFKLKTDEVPSRLYLYYNARVFIDKSPPAEDSGTTIRSICNATKKYLTCAESAYEYTNEFKRMPHHSAYTAPKLLKTITYMPVSKSPDAVKSTLLAGNPIICGVQLYSSFMTEEVGTTGLVPMPDPSVDTLVGGHAVLVTGYDSTNELVEVMNSWGANWGQKGFCYFPLEYFASSELFFDLWKVTVM